MPDPQSAPTGDNGPEGVPGSWPLSIRLLGALEVSIHGTAMPRLRTRAAAWILALLVLRQGRDVPRPWLAGTLWPDSRGDRALLNLRVKLMDLRKALGSESVRLRAPTRDTLRLDLTGAYVDVIDFDAALTAADEASLRHAVALYRGPLLEDCVEEWITVERESRAETCLQALEKLADRMVERDDYADALVYLARAEALEPLRDSVVRRRMAALAATGDLPAALWCYREHRHRLYRELNVEPDEATVRLFRELRAGRRDPRRTSHDERRTTNDEQPTTWEERDRSPHVSDTAQPVAMSPTPTLPGRWDGAVVANVGPASFVVRHAAPLPTPLTPLIGREEAVGQVRAHLGCARLVTLAGAGGIGKTRLALQVAAEMKDRFPEGAVFVELAAVSDPRLVPVSLATALGMEHERVDDGGDGERQARSLLQAITGWLTTYPVLLILDNCEHVIAAAAELARVLLRTCLELHILATSQQRLDLAGEVVWTVPPLLPPASVQLFVERAAAAAPGWVLTAAGSAAVERICRRLEGIPLAIELAAARAPILAPEQIADRLDDRFRLLIGGRRDALPRHRTLRALIDWSHDLLTATERTLLRRLAVFEGGWTLAAAEEVCADAEEGWILDLLAALEAKSLVLVERGESAARYRLLESVRAYAAEKLRESGDETAVRDRHLSYSWRWRSRPRCYSADPSRRRRWTGWRPSIPTSARRWTGVLPGAVSCRPATILMPA